jgi:hypothetical protein
MRVPEQVTAPQAGTFIVPSVRALNDPISPIAYLS